MCKNLISRILENLDLLWKRTAKERRFLISSSCTQDDGEPFHSMIYSEGASENATLFCQEENWRGFESICVSGEVMRLENQ